MKSKDVQPPQWADRFLGWYCSQAVREQVQGDAHELFYWRVEEKGLRAARRAFLWDVVRLFKWSNIKRKQQSQQLNHITMFKNYFKIGLRNLWKQKMPSTINIIGLSLAVGCCLVSFKWIESKFIKDRFHENWENIYLVTPTMKTEEGDNQRYGRTALVVGEMLKERVAGLENVVRYAPSGLGVKVGEKSFHSNAFFADPNFFDVFTFEFIHGDPTVLQDPRKVVFTAWEAQALFGSEHPIGQQVVFDLWGEPRTFEVGAVIQDPRENSSIRMGSVIHFDHFEKGRDALTTTAHTFIELGPNQKVASLQESFQQLASAKTNLTPDKAYEALGLEPLATVSRKNGNEILNGVGGMPPMAPVILLSCIGGFLLLLATFNYVNIATVMAMKRVKEIGVRKVIGSRRNQLITQFLTENLILCLLSMVLGCLLASAFFLPGFNNIAGSNLTLDLLGHQNLWWFMAGLLLFVTLASGAYPAFYISSFKPVVIFRGNAQGRGKRRLTGSLLTFQMILAVITIVAGVMFVRTNMQNESRDWGYDQYSKLVISIPESLSLNTVVSEVNKNANVIEVSASHGTIGRFHNFRKVGKGEKNIYASIFESDYKYPELMGVKLKEGSFFNKETQSQNQRSLLVNETFLGELGLAFDEVDFVTIDSTQYMLAGVVEDFHYSSFSDVIRPAAFTVVADSLLNNLTVKVAEGSLLEMRDKLQNILNELEPDQYHHAYAQETIFDGHFEEMAGIRNIMLFTATLSVCLAAMGLFGLVALSISSRIKDFGIKKVLGASLVQLSKDIYKRFILILTLAIVIGGTVSVFIIGALLDSVYGYHDAVGAIPLTLSGLVLLVVAAFTINTQVWQVKKMNPAETLRTE